MAFGKNLSQSKEETNPNNYCGGFAMYAILADLFGDGPKGVYDEIQEFQKEIPESLAALIEQMKPFGKGTNICLPSSLVKMARKAGFTTNLIYSELLQFSANAIEAEANRCGAETVEQVRSEDNLKHFSDSRTKYYLVLVNNCHWIAVKRKTKGDGFSVYDPETGGNKKFDKVQAMLLDWAASYKNAGALIITLQ